LDNEGAWVEGMSAVVSVLKDFPKYKDVYDDCMKRMTYET